MINVKSMFLMGLILCSPFMNTKNNEALATDLNQPVESNYNLESNSSYLVNVDMYETVKAQATDVYNKVFFSGESVVIYVNGDGDTDLDLYVYDENGNLIASDTDNTDTCVCTFTPRWRGNFKIKIKNLGRVYNRYHLRILQ